MVVSSEKSFFKGLQGYKVTKWRHTFPYIVSQQKQLCNPYVTHVIHKKIVDFHFF